MNNLLTVDILAYLPMNLFRKVEEIEEEFLDVNACLQILIDTQK